MTLGWKPRLAVRRRSPKRPSDLVLREFDHLDGAGPVRQTANEAALDERCDEPVNAGLGPQIEGVLHFIEGGGHAAFLHAPVDEEQKLFLFFGEHRSGLVAFHGLLSRLAPTLPNRESLLCVDAGTNRVCTLHVLVSFRKGAGPTGSVSV